MKSLLLVTLLLIGPALAAAAETKPAPRKAAQAASKPAAKTKATNSNARTKVSSSSRRKGKAISPSDVAGRSAAAQFAAGARAADRALTPAELELAERVQTGRIPCELGNVVVLAADPKAPGHFDLELQKMRFRMTPVETTTGALRLEDAQAGIVWLQLANKSMLMNQKLGQRLADDCMSPSQLQVADALKRSPARSIFDPDPAALTPAAAVAPAGSASSAPSNP